MAEALTPIIKFKQYKVSDSGAIRVFYLLPGAAIKGPRMVGHLRLHINDQTIPSIMGRCRTWIGRNGQ
jgi:hypothetical protein